MTFDISKALLVLKEKILDFQHECQLSEIGHIIAVNNGIAQVYGLDNIEMGEMVEFPDSSKGIALNLDAGSVGIICLSNNFNLKEGDIVKRTNNIFQVPVGMECLGRVLNVLGHPIDNKGKLNIPAFDSKFGYNLSYCCAENPSPKIMTRQSIRKPLETGIKVIDALIPIGQGQRELIIGDRKTGKTTLALDTILNQAKLNKYLPESDRVYCFYVAIAQKQSAVAHIVDVLTQHDALQYTTVVVAGASESVALQFIAPYAACAMAEYFRDHGMHALIVYDDLSKHAIAYRQISLLLQHPPGREAYPGDIFYLHSRLLERAAKLGNEYGGGSLTALPIIETQEGDFSSYIPTNVISITDGQIFLDTNLFYQNIKPAINLNLSVSRIGSAAQRKFIKNVVKTIKSQLSQYWELEKFSQLNTKLEKSTKDVLEYGKKVVLLLTQAKHAPISIEEQYIIFFLIAHKYINYFSEEEILGSVTMIIAQSKTTGLLDKIKQDHKELGDDISTQVVSSLHLLVNEIISNKVKSL